MIINLGNSEKFVFCDKEFKGVQTVQGEKYVIKLAPNRFKDDFPDKIEKTTTKHC